MGILTKKIRKIDKKDAVILNLLQDNCRASLTDLAHAVRLSIDSVKKRIQKMENVIFYPRIQIRPRSLGFSTISDIKIKLINHSEKEVEKLIGYLTRHPKVVELFSVSGEWNLSMVIISRDASDLWNITEAIKNRFGKIIGGWMESTTLKAYKFERYDMIKILEL